MRLASQHILSLLFVRESAPPPPSGDFCIVLRLPHHDFPGLFRMVFISAISFSTHTLLTTFFAEIA